MIIQFLSKIRQHPELFILLLVFIIITMLVIPLPTYLVDFLIGLNILLSALVFLSSFYIERILNFSSFPAVLLITTLFRLSLSISTSRLILNDADAGEIIATFGLFVIGDNLVVGFVIFAIVTIVQFLVITKGAERVAEVAARFSLDGMPGKQMSIDADLRAGNIEAQEAADKRTVLEKESQLYGSFDGAMKFIKGDAIAGILVIFINFIGGISVGISQHGMDMSTALSTYTMLTIGDGLVAQIPSLLIAISAGFIVTRVSGEGDNMGVTIVNQLLTKPGVLIIATFLALCIGCLPGFPFFIFLLLALLPGGLFFSQWLKTRRKQTEQTASSGAMSASLQRENEEHVNNDADTALGLIPDLNNVTPVTVPLILRVSRTSYEYLKGLNATERFRSEFFVDYGIHLPDMHLTVGDTVEDHKVIMLINEIRAEEYAVFFDKVAIINGNEEIEQLGIECINHNNVLWTDAKNRQTLRGLGFYTRTPVDELYYCLAPTLVRNVNEYFGIQETKSHLDKLEKDYPDLIKEVTRNITVQRVAEIFQRLLSERISVRNARLIAESIAHWAPREKDVITLVEHVRGTLSRYITHKFASANIVRVVLLSQDIEELFRKATRNTSTGSFLNLQPDEAERLMDCFDVSTSKIYMSHKDYVVLTSVDVRRFVKRFLGDKFRNLEVLSFGEITDSVDVEVLTTINMEG